MILRIIPDRMIISYHGVSDKSECRVDWVGRGHFVKNILSIAWFHSILSIMKNGDFRNKGIEDMRNDEKDNLCNR